MSTSLSAAARTGRSSRRFELAVAIVSADQAVRESVLAAIGSHADRLRLSVGRILSKRTNNRAALSASGTFIRFRGIDYFLTAAHALVDRGDGALLTATKKAGISIKEAVHSYVKNQEHAEDLLDAGLFRVTEEMKSQLGEITPIEIDRSITRAAYPPGHVFMIVGYPRSKNKKPLPESQLPPANDNVLVTGLKDDQRVQSHPDVRWQNHLVLGWSDQSSADLKGQTVNIGSLAGMSGGPVFDLGDRNDLAVLGGRSDPKPVLAGIFTRHLKAENALLGTRLGAIIDVLDKERAWPEP